VLLVDARPVFESMVINELVDELWPDPPLFPRDAIARAQARGWIVFSNDVVMPAGGAAMLAIAGGVSRDALAKPVRTLRDALESSRRSSRAAVARTPRARLLARVSAWVDAMLARPSVTAAEPADLDAKSRRFYEQRAAQQHATAG
jgi:glutathione S-transferase